MLNEKKLLRLMVPALAAACLALPTLAQDCGEAPKAPELVDGSQATMEELKKNSEAVKTYIADADEYLDCREAYVTSDAFKEMQPARRKAYIDKNREVLSVRNAIGEDFNEQVLEYKAAQTSS